MAALFALRGFRYCAFGWGGRGGSCSLHAWGCSVLVRCSLAYCTFPVLNLFPGCLEQVTLRF